ncbi:MAG: PD-(D/E)XK nuclease family protein [Candidatus Bipolaricaulota bacterium]
MKTKRSLTIDEIYREVRGYDLVFTAEASLADAINDRVEKPRIGKLAYTPRTYIYRRFQNQTLYSKRELFLELISRLDLDWKEASYLLDNVINVWEETGDLERILELSKFDPKVVKPVLEIVENTRNVFRELDQFQVREGPDVCVVAPYKFNELDRSILPGTTEELDVFIDEKIELSPFRVYTSANQLVGGVVDNVKRLDKEGVAVVVQLESNYDSLLRSHLRAAGIEFQASTGLQESEAVRGFVSCLELGISYPRIRLKEVNPLLRHIGGEPDIVNQEEYVSETNSPQIQEVGELLRSIREGSYAQAFSALEEHGLEPDEELKGVLEETELWSERVDGSSLNKLKYYLDNFEIELEERAGGLLLADPAGSSYIDREIVFYLGMSTNWDQSIREKPWRSPKGLRRRNVKNFKALIQNGESQFYMVQNEKLNRKVTPTTYFNELVPDLKSFTDGRQGESYFRYSRNGPEGDTFDDGHVNKSPSRVSVLSKTGLNALVQCPRDYFFSQLVEEPDRDYFRKGTVIHDFAEFYANFPDFVESKGLSTFVDLMVERIRPIVDEENLAPLRTEFRLATRLLVDYLKDREPAINPPVLQGYEPGENENYFAREFGKTLEREFTEMAFRNENVGCKGKVDLIAGSRLIDYKTGSKSSSSHIVKNSNVDLFEDNPDFQALLYLTHHRSVLEDRRIDFTFFHVLEDTGKVLREEFDLDDFTTTVSYYPVGFSDFLGREEVYDLVNTSGTRSKLLDPLGKEEFTKVMKEMNFDSEDFYSREGAKSYREQLRSLCASRLEVGRGKDLTERQLDRATNSILGTSLRRLRTRNFFRDDLDKFEEFLKEKLVELNRWRNTRFPVGDRDLDDISHRDLIMAGEGR